MSLAYYNENNPFAAQTLRNLIDAGHIAPGWVDERSIVEVRADDLAPFTQCHFFAGIGGWSLALDLAGVPRDFPLWTGSCPCQPFSLAGKGLAFNDPRHLWPVFSRLIAQRKPSTVLGEQVYANGKIGEWVDLVQHDVEALGYAFGCISSPACCIGIPGIRERVYWVAHAARRQLVGAVQSLNEYEVPGGEDSEGDSRASGVAPFVRDRAFHPEAGADGKIRYVPRRAHATTHGFSRRVGFMHALGNAINVDHAALFIRAALDY